MRADFNIKLCHVRYFYETSMQTVVNSGLFRAYSETRFHIFFTAEKAKYSPCSSCAVTSVIKRKSAVTRALLKAVGGGNKQVARVPFFGSFLSIQERIKRLLQVLSFVHLYKPALNESITVLFLLKYMSFLVSE